MTRRLVSIVVGGAIPGESVKVYRDAEWGEYRAVLCYEGGKASRFTYHTDDLGDAMGTAREMIGVGTAAANAAEVAS